MKGILIKDWTKFDPLNRDHMTLLGRNLGKFMAEPIRHPELRGALAKIQEFGTPQDFPTSVLEVLERFHLTTAFDNGYEQVFNVRNYSESKRNGFDMMDVQSGLTFEKKAIGDKIIVAKPFGGPKAHVYFDFYGGGLGWHKSLFDDEEYWQIEDNAIEFRNKAYLTRAQVFYALIDALPVAQNLVWQVGDDTLAVGTVTYCASRDIATMNLAAVQILLAVANKGYGVNPQNANFIVLCPLQLRGRLRKALGLQQLAITGAEKFADFNFQLISTTMLANPAVYYVILPKIKLIAGYRMDLAIFTAFDMLSYTESAAGWMRYGGAIGDTEQLVRCASA